MPTTNANICIPRDLIFNLTLIELQVLSVIIDNVPPNEWTILTNGTIANTVGIDRSRIPRTLKNLENLGLVERRVTHEPGLPYVKAIKRKDFS